MTESNIPVLSVGRALLSMRQAPYTTESALAELIDNSLQAKAENIAILAKDELEDDQAGRPRSKLKKIAVFDDGKGMDKDTLQKCLSVGFSRNKEDPQGLGKFGFGMLIGALSQCYRMEVYSRQDGGEIFHTYIDIPELVENENQNIPEITPIDIDDVPIFGEVKLGKDDYLSKFNSGTLVVLDKLDKDKIKFTTQKGIFNLISNNLGRIYRHFLDDDDTYGAKKNIEIIGFDPNGDLNEREILLPNDPMYLLTPNTLPLYKKKGQLTGGEDYTNTSTNILLETPTVIEIDYPVYDETGNFVSTKKSEVTITATIVNPELRYKWDKEHGNAGSTNIGKHYADNQGISIVRAGREITLDTFGYVNSYTPTERWWGIEIRFNPELDGIFGLSNDKQSVTNFISTKKVKKDWWHDHEENPKKVAMVEIDKHIDRLLITLRSLIKKTKGTRTGTSSDKKDIIKGVDVKIKEDTTPTQSKIEQDKKSREEKLKELQTLYEKEGLNPDDAKEKAKQDLDLSINFILDDWPGDVFFDVKNVGSGAFGIVNTDHLFFESFFQYLQELEEDKGSKAMQITLMAYVRTEDELKAKLDSSDTLFEEFRNRWGYWIKELISISDD